MVSLSHSVFADGWGIMSYMQRLRGLREDSDKTQQEIANFLGISQTMYARYERGANELPIRHLVKLCELYGASADYVLEIAPEYKRKSGH